MVGQRFTIEEIPSLKQMFETGQSMAVPRTKEDPTWVDTPETRWINSYAASPIRIRDEIVGFINLSSATPGFFTEIHAKRLQAFAEQTGIAINNASLLEAERDQRLLAETLTEVTLALTSQVNPTDVLDEILRQVQRLVPYTAANLMLVEGDKLTPIKGTGTNTAETGSQNEELPPVKLPDGGKSWPTITMPDLGNAKAELTSYWHNGKLHYVIELHPFSKRLKLLYSGYYTNPSLSLQLNNASGKQVAWTSLPTKQMKHTINKMRNVEELSGEGVITTSKEHYDSIAGWQLYWNPR